MYKTKQKIFLLILTNDSSIHYFGFLLEQVPEKWDVRNHVSSGSWNTHGDVVTEVMITSTDTPCRCCIVAICY